MPHVLVIQADRESNTESFDQLQRLKTERPDCTLSVLRRRAPWWQWDRRRVAAVVDQLLLVDPQHHDSAVRAVVDMARDRPFDAVVSVHEECLRLAARMVEALGLRGPPHPVVETCRDKWALRSTLAAAGIATPQAHLARSHGEARQAAQALGLPVVVKPRDLAGGIGVTAVNRLVDLPAAYDLAARAHWMDSRWPGVLVEPLIAGPTIAANALMVGDELIPLGASDKTCVDAPYFSTHEEAMPSEHDGAALWQIVENAARCLGLRDTVLHMELVLGDAGASVLEVTPRLGGGPGARLVEVTQGVWPLGLGLQLALGEAVPKPKPAACGRARILRTQKAGRIVALESPTALPPRTELRKTLGIGDFVAPPPRSFVTALGWVLAWGEEPAVVARRVARVAGAVSLETAPEASLSAVHALASRAADPEYRQRFLSWASRFGGRA